MNIKLINFVLYGFIFFTTAFVAPALQAQNVQFFYSIQGGQSWTWVMPVSPTVIVAGDDYFTTPGVAGAPGGTGNNLTFFTDTAGGGFNSSVGSTNFVVSANFYPDGQLQLFGGLLTNPTFITGTFSGVNVLFNQDNIPATLVISEVAVPEPATYATLAGGLALVALAAAKRKKQNVISP